MSPETCSHGHSLDGQNLFVQNSTIQGKNHLNIYVTHVVLRTKKHLKTTVWNILGRARGGCSPIGSVPNRELGGSVAFVAAEAWKDGLRKGD